MNHSTDANYNHGMSGTEGLSSGEFYDKYWSSSPDFSAQNPSSIFRREWVVSLSRKLVWKTHLDVGCGNGRLIECIHHASAGSGLHTGIDVSPKVIAGNQGALPHHRFMVKDVSQDSLDDTFDLVTCLEVLEHLPVEGSERAVATLASRPVRLLRRRPPAGAGAGHACQWTTARASRIFDHASSLRQDV